MKTDTKPEEVCAVCKVPRADLTPIKMIADGKEKVISYVCAPCGREHDKAMQALADSFGDDDD